MGRHFFHFNLGSADLASQYTEEELIQISKMCSAHVMDYMPLLFFFIIFKSTETESAFPFKKLTQTESKIQFFI